MIEPPAVRLRRIPAEAATPFSLVQHRAQVLVEGDYCYALTFGVREGLWSDYDSTAKQVFASLGLISAEMA